MPITYFYVQIQRMKKIIGFAAFILLLLVHGISQAQKKGVNWAPDGLSYYQYKSGQILRVDPKTSAETVLVKAEQLQPTGSDKSLVPQSFDFYGSQQVLIFTNTARVWRYHTRGDYWVLNLANNQLRKLGKGLPEQSLMFAKFSPDGKQVAYVSEHNIFTEDVSTGIIRKLTTDGNRKLINGTFDWVYEEEFNCRDGFRWSPDGREIAFWQIDATRIRDFYMINNTDSVYSRIIPVEYPKVGEAPSPARIGVVNLANAFVRWMKIDGDPSQHYLTRMEWTAPGELIVQQLDRRQQESRLIYCNSKDGSSRTFWAENDDAWVDLNTDNPVGWYWINGGEDFLWVSEKDGWRHVYKISRDGKSVTDLTKGAYDIGQIKAIDEKNNHLYVTASPENATQLYLYRVRLNPAGRSGKDEPELVSGNKLKGTHDYDIGPFARFARHTFSNASTPPVAEWVSLPDHRPLQANKSIQATMKQNPNMRVEYMQVVTEDNIQLDAWIHKPASMNPTKKYPVVFYVYGEAAAATVGDTYGNHSNFLYNGDMSADGYVQVALDNRGTPSLKGAGWRKSIYRNNGQVNIRDMAMGAKKILELPYMDRSRVAVWGWSGGGSSTLHLMFRYPEIFQTGISIAAVTNLLYYDNIYTERYMGLPSENADGYRLGSAITYAKDLKGNLLVIHGTGDDNVHYSNAEALINELVKHNKTFSFMAYPNRSHSMAEGEGTWEHLSKLYTEFLKKHCPPGGK